jgi:hypothetical protein
MKAFPVIFAGLTISLLIQANLRGNPHGIGHSIGKQLRATDDDMDLKDLHQSVSELGGEFDEYDEDAFLEGVQHGYYWPEYQEELLNNTGGQVTHHKGTKS